MYENLFKELSQAKLLENQVYQRKNSKKKSGTKKWDQFISERHRQAYTKIVSESSF